MEFGFQLAPARQQSRRSKLAKSAYDPKQAVDTSSFFFESRHQQWISGELLVVTKYLFVWLLLAVVAIANGILRQSTYGETVSELTAHQISTMTAILASGVVVWIANRIWPIESTSQALIIGVCWLVMTVIFEFGFGHYIAGHPWDKLTADYNLLEGRVWSLFLIWVAIVPFVIFELAQKLPGVNP